MDCSYEDAGVKLQDRLCDWLANQGENEVADWFSEDYQRQPEVAAGERLVWSRHQQARMESRWH